MRKIFLKIFFILILGALGGVIFQAFLLPYLAAIPYFQKFQFIKILTEREVKTFPKETVIVQENIALQNAIEKVEKVAIGVKSQPKKGKALEGSGLILTRDGLMITLASLVPQGADFNFFWEGEKIPYQILKRDLKTNLALVKLNKTNLPTAGFSSLEKIKQGQRIFLIGISFKKPTVQGEEITKKIVNEGIIQSFDEDSIETNIFEKNTLAGSPLFDIEGNVLGLNTIDQEGKVITTPIKKIKEFAGL